MDIKTITYQGKLKSGEEQMFRGAFIKKMGEGVNPLLHNHVGDGLRYSYPLIQYKIWEDRPTIIGIGEGSDLLTDLLPTTCKLMIGKQEREFKLEHIKVESYEPEISEIAKMYEITKFMPLNKNNKEEFESLPALTDRISFLENIINANILAFFKGIGFHCHDEIYSAISSIDKSYHLYYKNVKFLGLNLCIITNVLLPDGIGLGKSTSVGFGTLRRIPIPRHYQKKLEPRMREE